MDKKLQMANKIYPWYSGLSSDLIFYIAINTIWLTSVKGFSASQITFLTTIASLFAVIFQVPILSLIKKIGNTKSIRIGSLCLLISSIMLTFCTKYFLFIIANIFLEISLTFETMSAILIKHNLDFLNIQDEYIKMRSKASLVYAGSTAVITLFIGVIFNLYAYLPMILGIIVCLICFLISFFLFDIEEVRNVEKEKLKEDNKEEKKKIPSKHLNLCLLLLLFYGIIFSLVVIGQQNGKLLIQQQLLESFSLERVATYLGIVLFTSRIVRIIINFLYPRIYKILKDKMMLFLTFSLILALFLILLGFYLNINILMKTIIMTLGFSILPSLRDPINIYCQSYALERFEKQYHKEILAYLTLSRHIGKFLLSLLASYVLLKLPLQYLFIIFIIICISLLYFSFKIINQKSKNSL